MSNGTNYAKDSKMTRRYIMLLIGIFFMGTGKMCIRDSLKALYKGSDTAITAKDSTAMTAMPIRLLALALMVFLCMENTPWII